MKKDKGEKGDLERRLATFANNITHPTRKDWLNLILNDIRGIIKQELSYASPYKDALSDGLTAKVNQFTKYARNELANTVHNYKLMAKHRKETKRAVGELGKDLGKLVYEGIGYLFPFSADYSVDKRISHALIGSNILGIAAGGLVTISADNPLVQIVLSSATCETVVTGGFIVSFPVLTEVTNLWRQNRYGKRISGNKAPETLNRLKKIRDYTKHVGAAATVAFLTETALISFMTYAPKAVSAGISYLTGNHWDFEVPIEYVTPFGLTVSSGLFIIAAKVSTYNLNNGTHRDGTTPKADALTKGEYNAGKPGGRKGYHHRIIHYLISGIADAGRYVAARATSDLNAIKQHIPLYHP